MDKHPIGNPNQPNFSYIPVTATSGNDKLGPGYGQKSDRLGAFSKFPRFSEVPRFSSPLKKKRVVSPTQSYIKKFNDWSENAVHFSRRSPKKNCFRSKDS